MLVQRKFPASFLIPIASAFVLLPFYLDDYHIMLMSEILIWGLFAIGFNLIYGYLGMLSFGQSIFFGAGAYSFAFAIVVAKLNIVLSLCFAILVPAFFAAIIGLVAVRTRNHYFMIITMIFSVVVLMVLQSGHWRFTGGYGGIPFEIPKLQLGLVDIHLEIQQNSFYFILCVFTLALFFCKRILDSPLGMVFLSIRENEERARIIGYNIYRYKLIAFILSGALSGLAGGLYAVNFRYTNLVFFHWTTSINVIVATVIGGAGTLVGPLLGTSFIILFKEYMTSWSHYAGIIIGVILILIVCLSPGGFAGMILNFYSKKTNRNKC